MLIKILSAIILAVLVGAIIILAPVIVFDGVILLVIMGGLYEFYKLSLPADPRYREAGWIWGVVVAASILFRGDFFITTLLLVAGLFVVFVIHMHHSTTLEGVTSRVALTALGVLYLGVTLPFWGLLRELPHGRALVFMGIAAAALSDSFALFAGKMFGRRKFAPTTSPNKTWEGFLFGIVGSIFGVYVVGKIGWSGLSIFHILILGLLIGCLGPMGDLIESLIKRDFHVKDSGTIIPGHGGFLDRLDAMIFVGPFLYFYVKAVLSVWSV